METKTVTVTLHIQALKEQVWKVLTQQPYMNEWMSVMMPDSVVKGTVALGEHVIYTDGHTEGIVAEVAEFVSNKFLRINVIGEAKDGKLDPENPNSELWQGSYDQYTLSEEDGKTVLSVESAFPAKYADDFTEGWNKMTRKIQEIAEREA